METVQRSDDEINEVLNKADDVLETGRSRYPGMTYEEGVANAIRWLLGHHEDNPIEDE
jgi:hypothetical protein